MAFIKVEPGQTKTVVALIGVLIVTLGVTAFRLKPEAEIPAKPQQQQAPGGEAGSSTAGIPTSDVRLDRSRNPFDRPARAARPGISQRTGSWQGTGGANRLVAAHVEPFEVESLLPVGATEVSAGNAATRAVREEPESTGSRAMTRLDPTSAPSARMNDEQRTEPSGRPSFVLLATVKGSHGYGAVISLNGSVQRVVQVGDVLEGGFRVRVITADHALLSDGREIVIAKRPQS